MPALETLHGLRVVASPAVLDTALWPDNATVLRLAPDDVFAIGATAEQAAHATAADPDAIIADESGFVGCWLDAGQLETVATHIEWHLPTQRPALAQGYVAGVPAKLWLDTDRALLLCASPYAADLIERLK
ncbi:unannotated protein [freshwater metagenome]|uniref:Unannotated protein n=1 Tax=freshwater metagenome TaxID=449393 RepID=A0A6J7EWI7_9ZZZZ|nr:hypothetical protein [Actinomycetota bacterium]